MLNTPVIEISHNADLGIGRALSPRGPILGRINGPTIEQFVTSYVKQIRDITGLSDVVYEMCPRDPVLTFTSYYGDQEDGCPTHLVIAFLAYTEPNRFTDGRGYSKVTDRTLMQMLGAL